MPSTKCPQNPGITPRAPKTEGPQNAVLRTLPRGNARSPRSTPVPDANRAKRRDELLHVAAEVFAERGYGGASMREIAARWGVQAAALYYYYPSKAMLLAGICEYGIARFLERVGAIATSNASAEDKVRDALRAHIEPLIEDRFYVHAFLYLRRELPKPVRRPLDLQARRYEALWRSIVAEGQAGGTIPKSIDPAILVLAILGMANSVARWSRSGTSAGVDPIARVFTHLVSFGLFGSKPPARLRRSAP